MSAPSEATKMTDLLERFFADHLNESGAVISNVHRVSAGRSRQNWTFDLQWTRDEAVVSEALILRRDPQGGLVETDRQTEFAVLTCLEKSAVPAPIARWIDPDGSWFGSPSLIMRREPGECDYYILNGNRPLSERVNLARQICDLLVLVHQTDTQATDLRDVLVTPSDPPAQQLEQWESVLRADQAEPYPEIELALRWLEKTAPAPSGIGLVHGDFKPGNILFRSGKITALLDWELAHIGDPAEDLGWVTQPLREREHLIQGHWGREELLERYTLHTGTRIPVESLHWWNLFATFRTAVMQVSGLRSYLEGRSRDFYRPTPSVLRALLEGVTELTGGPG